MTDNFDQGSGDVWQSVRQPDENRLDYGLHDASAIAEAILEADDELATDDPWAALLRRNRAATRLLRTDPRVAAERLRQIGEEALALAQEQAWDLAPHQLLILAILEMVRLMVNLILRLLGMADHQIADLGLRPTIPQEAFAAAVGEIARTPAERLLALLEAARLGKLSASSTLVEAAAIPLLVGLDSTAQLALRAWIDRYTEVPDEAAEAIVRLDGMAACESSGYREAPPAP